MKTATLQDVANLAGVSAGTVSKYINGQKIRPKNAEQVKKAIEELHYVPSPLAQNFARGRTFDVLLFIIVEYPIVASTWLHELPMIQSISDVLRDTPYNLKIEIAYTSNSEQNCKRMQACVDGRRVDAVILLTPWEIDSKLIKILDNSTIPHVLLGSSSDMHCLSFDFDNVTPVYDIVTRVYENGHRRFAMLSGFKEQFHTIKREQGFRRALQDLGLDDSAMPALYGDYSMESGIEMASALLDLPNPPTAFICGNDNIAAGAIRAIRSRGLSVPEDVVVSGFDDSAVATAVRPAITSVQPPSYEIAKTAATELLALLDDNSYHIRNPMMQCQVFYRRSTEGRIEN